MKKKSNKQANQQKVNIELHHKQKILFYLISNIFQQLYNAVDTAIGYQPKAEDINIDGLDIDLDTLKGLLGVDKELWTEETKGIREYYAKFGDKVPAELLSQLETLENNLK